jgi:hypothetical protein
MMLIVILTIWLGILGPLPHGVAEWLQHWQTLVAAFVASIAAYIAFQNTSRSLRHTEGLEKHRRSRKHAALRAVLPLALAQVTDYAERSAHSLNELINQCVDETFPAQTVPDDLVEPLPSETLQTLADFIEYSDTVDVSVLERTVAWIQIHDSRLRKLIKRNRDPADPQIVSRAEIEARIIDAASIYGGAAAIYDYARGRATELPRNLLWEAVTRALRNMRFWDDEYPRLHVIVAGRANHSTGPFDGLNVGVV